MSRLQRAANTATGAIHNVGVKVGGRTGAMVTDTLVGRHWEECSDECGWCDAASDPSNPPRP